MYVPFSLNEHPKKEGLATKRKAENSAAKDADTQASKSKTENVKQATTGKETSAGSEAQDAASYQKVVEAESSLRQQQEGCDSKYKVVTEKDRLRYHSGSTACPHSSGSIDGIVPNLTVPRGSRPVPLAF